jgi:xanthine dehydrogenase small subunit
VVGAAVSLAQGWAAILEFYPQLEELVQRFGSPPVRNSGTLCGNLANGSPIGDSMPILIALGAELELRRGTSTRRLLLERFYLGYQKKDLAHGEFVVAVRVPAAQPGLRVASYKVSKRIDQDISAVCGAFAIRIEKGRIVAARIAFGGMAAIPARAAAAERALIGNEWSAEAIAAAGAALEEDFKPLTDLRATGRYRLRVGSNLLRRFYLEQSGEVDPVRTDTLTELI